jgi:hypothetical protein
MSKTTFFPNLRIARDLKISLKKEKVEGGYSCSYKYSVRFDGRLLGNISQDLPSTGVQTSISLEDCQVLVDALKAKGASPEAMAEFHFLPADAMVSGLLSTILGEEESLQKMKRRAKTKILWVTHDAKPGDFMEMKHLFSEYGKRSIIAAYPENTIAFFINDDIADL